MSDTPRTDALTANQNVIIVATDVIRLARTLERELANEREISGARCLEIERLNGVISDSVKWVSVEERVPTDDSSVIVHLHGGARTVGVWSGGAWYNQKCRAFVSLGENVTHWMPLLEAPK